MFQYIQYFDDFVLTITALLTIASVITRFTKTPKDDAVVHQLMEFMSILKSKDVPGTFKAPLTSSLPPEENHEKDTD